MSATITPSNRGLQSSELFWATERGATATPGHPVLVDGSSSDWTPAGLLATAAGASLLTTFLEIAADAQLPVLGYVAQQSPDMDPATNEVSRIMLSACISVPTPGAAQAARIAWALAVKRAPILRALGRPVVANPSIVVLNDDVDGR